MTGGEVQAGARIAIAAALALLVYTYLAYPGLVWLRARLLARPPRRAPHTPPVSVVIVAQDEEEPIEPRIRNLLGLDYPREQLEILIASDGSRDATVARAQAFEAEGIRVLAFGARRGKAAVLSEVLPLARGEIVVLGDVRQRFEPAALRALVAPFADPQVGAVGGELVLTGADGARQGVGLYWRYETLIRKSEGAFDSTVGVTGAIYAIRRSLFEPIPADTVLDDVLIPLRIAARGYRVVFEPAARAHDRVSDSARDEFRRKVRTLAGNFQLFRRHAWTLSPRKNRLWFETVSHKGLRLLTPLGLAAVLAANVLLLRETLFRLLLLSQAAFYALALAGHLLREAPRRIPFASVPYVVCLLAWATVVAFLRFVTCRQAATWERVRPRTGAIDAVDDLPF